MVDVNSIYSYCRWIRSSLYFLLVQICYRKEINKIRWALFWALALLICYVIEMLLEFKGHHLDLWPVRLLLGIFVPAWLSVEQFSNLYLVECGSLGRSGYESQGVCKNHKL
jgi:hypothetical protein